MNKLLLGVSLLALLAPAAYALASLRTSDDGRVRPGKYRVFFNFNQATLTSDGARVVGEAAEKYKRTGAARIEVTGRVPKLSRASWSGWAFPLRSLAKARTIRSSRRPRACTRSGIAG